MLSQGLSSRNTYKREGKPKAESKKFGNRHVIAAIAVAPAATGDSAPFKWEGAQEEQETAAGSHLHNDAAPAAGQRLDATSTDGAAPFAWEVPDDAEVPTNALHDESAPAAGVIVRLCPTSHCLGSEAVHPNPGGQGQPSHT